MTASGWIQLVVLIALVGATAPFLGIYIARIYGDGEVRPLERVFGPVENAVFRLCRIGRREQRWTGYAVSLLAFSLVSVLFLYALQRFQGGLPGNPNGFDGVPAPLSFNTAISFVTNTNWQNYAGESTMSFLTQAAGLAVQNFVSAAVGLTVAIALIRGLVRRRRSTIGNFWVDLTRGVLRILLPLAFLAAIVLASQGVVQNLSGDTTVTTVEGAEQVLPGGQVASQESIKELGTNGGGFYNANSAHPFENPNGFTNMLQLWMILVIPVSLPFAFGRMAKDRRQGLAVLAAMMALWLAGSLVAMHFEANGNPNLTPLGVDQQITATQPGGNMEGKETRFGPEASGLYANTTTGTSTGAVISSHDSFTPAGGAVPLVQIMFGEVSPGGVGAGLYGMLIFALLSVFIAGLMVGRTPEYLGKKIQASEMKLVVLYVLFVPICVLGFTGLSVVSDWALSSLLNTGPHGLTEMTYAFTSAANNNGSAFGGLTGNTDWFNTTLGLSMLVGRFFLIIPALAIAGSLVRKQKTPASAGTFPTGTPLFATLLTGIVVIVVGLTYFPVVALGPIVEQLTQGS
ncbi:MAG TPA: potassium-transporting ATPase subunit KdpA [Acidimicrobiales bacterium]